MTTIARQYIDDLNNRRDDGSHVVNVVNRYHEKILRYESNYDITISWYRDGSATWIGEHSRGVEIWMDEDCEGYEDARTYFSAITDADKGTNDPATADGRIPSLIYAFEKDAPLARRGRHG